MSFRKLLLKSADIERMPGDRRVHFLNPNAVRERKSLGDAVGLSAIGVHIVTVEPGRDSTEFHRHWNEEECIYVLSGKGTLRIEDETFEFERGDFVGFPAGVAAHDLKNAGNEPLVILVMGQRLDFDVADYPDKGKRLFRHGGVWDLVDMEHLSDPRKLSEKE